MNISTENLIKFLTTLGLAAVIFCVSFWYYTVDNQIKYSLSNHLERTELEVELWRLDFAKNELLITLPTHTHSTYQVYNFNDTSEYHTELSKQLLTRYEFKNDSMKPKVDSLNNIMISIAEKNLKKIVYQYDEKIRSKNLMINKVCLVILGLIGSALFCYGIFYWKKMESNSKTLN